MCKKLIVFIFLFAVNLIYSTFGQQWDTIEEADSCRKFHRPALTSLPPLNTSMPLDVLIGYIALDSICRNVEKEEFESRVRNMTLDSLKYGLKYLQRIANYDRLLYGQYNRATYKREGYKIWPNEAYGLILEQFRQRTQLDRTDSLLLQAMYIYHVRPIDQIVFTTPWVFAPDTARVEIYCTKLEVLDVVVGDILPNSCRNLKHIVSSPQALGCITVSWSRRHPEDTFDRHDSLFQESRGPGLLEIGKEYIALFEVHTGVLADTAGSGAESYDITIDYRIGRYAHETFILPIEQGIVIDQYNSFGLGEVMPVASFKDRLRRKLRDLFQ